MYILIIGSNGFIGSHATQFFINQGYRVRVCDIHQKTPDTFLLNENLSNLPVLFEHQQYDVCLNASGSATVAFSIEHQEEDYRLNYLNVEIILNSLKKYNPNCKFINLSSAAVYGNPITLPLSEKSNKKPVSPYGKHKLLSEKLLELYAKINQTPCISMRIFSVYGNGLRKQLFWDIYQQLKKNNTQVELYGNGLETRDFIHISDLMKAINLIIREGSFNGTAVNVASGTSYTVHQAAEIFIKHISPQTKIVFNGLIKKTDPRFWEANIDSLKGLGFYPETTLEQGLKNYALWLQGLD